MKNNIKQNTPYFKGDFLKKEIDSMKTLANCNSKDFLVQTYKIGKKIKKYSDGIKKITEQFQKKDDSKNAENIFKVLSYICEENIDDTMELCGELCFMTGEEFAALDPEKGDEDGIIALTKIFNSERCINFFTSALQIGKVTGVLQ